MKFFQKIIISLVIIIGIYAIFLVISDVNTLYDKITKFKLEFLPIIFSLITFGYFVLCLRWHLLLRNSKIYIPIKSSFLIFFSGFAFSFIPGEVGDFVKSQLLKNKFGISRTKTVPIIVSEWLYNGVGLVGLSLLGIFYFEISVYLGLIFSAILIFLFFITNSKKLFIRFLAFASKRKFLSSFTENLDDSFVIIKNSTRGKIAVYCSFLSASFWLIESISVYFILYAFGVSNVGILDIVPIYSSSILLGVASFLPLGIGVVESSFAGFLHLFGVELSLGLAIIVIIRIFTRWYSILIGLLVLKFYGGTKKIFDM